MDPFVNKVHLEPSCAVLVHVCGSFPAKVAEPRLPSREEVTVYRNSFCLLFFGPVGVTYVLDYDCPVSLCLVAQAPGSGANHRGLAP